MKQNYYYLEANGNIVVSDIAHGGSQACKVSKYGDKTTEKPYLFNTKEEAQYTVDRSYGKTYMYKDENGNKQYCEYDWQVKAVEITF